MYSRNMDTEAALEEIRNVRPNVEYVATPNTSSLIVFKENLDLMRVSYDNLKSFIKPSSKFLDGTKQLGCFTWREPWKKS
jgi:hypothetical protein